MMYLCIKQLLNDTYYTNKFIIISYRRSSLFSAKCNSVIPIMHCILSDKTHVISSVHKSSTCIFSLYSSYPICSSLPTSCHPFYVTHQTATSHYLITTSSAVALQQSTNTPFLPPIRLCRTLSFVSVPVQMVIILCFTSSFMVTFQIPTIVFHHTFLCPVGALVSNNYRLANASLTIAILVLISLSRFIHLFLVSFPNT